MFCLPWHKFSSLTTGDVSFMKKDYFQAGKIILFWYNNKNKQLFCFRLFGTSCSRTNILRKNGFMYPELEMLLLDKTDFFLSHEAMDFGSDSHMLGYRFHTFLFTFNVCFPLWRKILLAARIQGIFSKKKYKIHPFQKVAVNTKSAFRKKCGSD